MLRAFRSASVAPAEPDTLPRDRYRAYKQLGLFLLCTAWAGLGIVGRDPWKTEDATAFGVAWGMMNGGSMLAPSLAGEPYIDRPPLVHALAAIVAICLWIVHVYAAIWVRGTINAMTRGKVTGGWAWRHHRRWLREIVTGKRLPAETSPENE